MENCDCSKNNNGYCILEVIISIIIGIAVGIVFSLGLLTNALSFIIIALIAAGITILILGGSLFAANLLDKCNNFEKCICNVNICLLISTIGTLLAGTVSIAVGFVITSVVSILAVAITAFFFIWMILSLINLISCLMKRTCKKQ